MAETGLAVIEARWWEEGNHSVRPLFETLAAIATGNPFDFRYDMFADRGSLDTHLSSICSSAKFHSIYLASHGDEVSIQASLGNLISRAVLRNCLRNANNDHHVTGIYFGSCLICNEDNAKFLMDAQSGANVNWIAGYSKKVDWVDSSCVDMMFWSKLLQERERNRRRRKGKWPDLKMVRAACDEMKNLMPNVFMNMGFNVYWMNGANELEKGW